MRTTMLLVMMTMAMMMRIMLTAILVMKMHEYDNDGDDGDGFFFSELSIHGYARNVAVHAMISWTGHVDGLMQPLHSRSHAVILALEIHLEGQVTLVVLGGVTELLGRMG